MTLLRLFGLLTSVFLSVHAVDILNDISLINPRHEFMKTVKSPYYFGVDNSTMPFYSIHGDAQVLPRGVRLTPEASGKTGAIWSKTPSNLKEWVAVMAVHIKGSSPIIGSEGMAFWYTEESAKLGPIFGSKDRWNGLGIFFDSHDNIKKKSNLAIQAVYNSLNYDYPKDQNGQHHTFARCFREYRNTFLPFLVKIIYTNRTLTVEVDSEGHGVEFEKCFSYSPIFLNPGFYFGVSAMTGEIPDQHELISLDVYELNTKYDTSQADKIYKKLDEKAINAHEEYQHRLHDSMHKKDSQDFKSTSVDMHFLEKMVRTIEETLSDLYDRFDSFTSRSSGSVDNTQIETRLSNIERQLSGVTSSLATISDTLLQLAGHESGSKSLMDQVAQLNQIAHNKLSFLEENSKQTFQNAERLHAAFEEKSTSSFWWYVALIALQLMVVIWLAINWKKNSKSNVDKKFI